MTPPTATVVRHAAMFAVIQCPYCDKQHVHPLVGAGPQHRAPGCGLHRSPTQRLAGYTFHIPKENHR